MIDQVPFKLSVKSIASTPVQSAKVQPGSATGVSVTVVPPAYIPPAGFNVTVPLLDGETSADSVKAASVKTIFTTISASDPNTPSIG